MSEMQGNTPDFRLFRGHRAMKFDLALSFRLNSSPSGEFSIACSVFP